MPILRKDEIEDGAEELLYRFCPNALTDIKEHNPYLLAKRMGLQVARLRLHKKKSTLSMLFFCDGELLVDDEVEDSDSFHKVSVPGNTIVINTNAVHKDYCELEIYHECIHFDWHFMFYRLQHMNNNDAHSLKTRRILVKNDAMPATPLKWVEWQARRGSFGLMMPLSQMSD